MSLAFDLQQIVLCEIVCISEHAMLSRTFKGMDSIDREKCEAAQR
jgi:hypothetical protein